MKKIFIFAIVLFSLSLFSGCQRKNTENLIVNVANEKQQTLSTEALMQKAKEDANLTFWSDYPSDILAKEIVSRMTNDELLSQLFMFGWAGAEPNKLVTYWVEERNIGSIKIFGWNTDDVELVAQNITNMQQKAMSGRFEIPLYVATDQEGGWIRHVKGTTSDTPGNLAIGSSGLPQDAYLSGYYISKELRALGINMNFAPPVDLYTDHDSSVIGPRSFGEDAMQVSILGTAFSRGSMDVGVIPTAKHFPGHGDTGLDSHGRLPLIDINEETLFNRELAPFSALIESNIPAIMSGHLAFPQITRDPEPASLSTTFLQNILRKKMGFEGLIISDDMMMNAATVYAGGLAEAFTMALKAGNNILCSSTTPQIYSDVWTNNIELMEESVAFREVVADSAYRVIKSKLDYFKGDNPVPIYPKIEAIKDCVPDKDGDKFFMEQACRSVTLYKKGDFPISAEEGGKVLLAGQFQEFFDEGVKKYPDAGLFYFRYSPDSQEIANYVEELKWKASYYDTVIIFITNQAGKEVAKALSEVDARIVIVSGLAPTFVMNDFDWADSILMCYSYSLYSIRAIFSALAGDFSPQGVFPLANRAEYDSL